MATIPFTFECSKEAGFVMEQHTLHFANSSTKKVSRPWGLAVGTLGGTVVGA
jgi:hypothetical protein